jgi:hypothetical protein
VKPDFGLKVIRDGVSREMDFVFYDFVMFSLTVLGAGRYSTMLDRLYDGEWYALSLDFNQRQLETILSHAAPTVAQCVRRELSRDPSSPRSLDFDQEVRFGVRARLGPLQRGQTEDFVPLVCQEVMPGLAGATALSEATDSLIVTVERNDVVRRRIDQTLMTLRGSVERSTRPQDLRGRLQLAFDGYDADRRELWAIPEVREFVNLLDGEFPFWFYFADLRTDFLKVIAFCLCRVSSPGPGGTAIHPQDFAVFLERHFGAMNQLLEHWHVNDGESVSNEIVQYFDAARVLN